MTGASDATEALREAVAAPIAAVAAATRQSIAARDALREADDLVPTMEAVAGLILAMEALQEAAKRAESEARAHLARAMMATGATTFRSETHTVSVKEGARRVLVTDAAAIPPELMVQPPPKPDLTEIGKRLRDGKPVQGTALGNGGEPIVQIRNREKKAA